MDQSAENGFAFGGLETINEERAMGVQQPNLGGECRRPRGGGKGGSSGGEQYGEGWNARKAVTSQKYQVK